MSTKACPFLILVESYARGIDPLRLHLQLTVVCQDLYRKLSPSLIFSAPLLSLLRRRYFSSIRSTSSLRNFPFLRWRITSPTSRAGLTTTPRVIISCIGSSVSTKARQRSRYMHIIHVQLTPSRSSVSGRPLTELKNKD